MTRAISNGGKQICRKKEGAGRNIRHQSSASERACKPMPIDVAPREWEQQQQPASLPADAYPHVIELGPIASTLTMRTPGVGVSRIDAEFVIKRDS